MGFSFRDDLPKCQLVENARRVGDSSVARDVPALIEPIGEFLSHPDLPYAGPNSRPRQRNGLSKNRR
jgi:hypothetical protein